MAVRGGAETTGAPRMILRGKDTKRRAQFDRQPRQPRDIRDRLVLSWKAPKQVRTEKKPKKAPKPLVHDCFTVHLHKDGKQKSLCDVSYTKMLKNAFIYYLSPLN